MVGQCDKEGRDKSEDQVGERPDLYPLCTVGQPGRQGVYGYGSEEKEQGNRYGGHEGKYLCVNYYILSDFAKKVTGSTGNDLTYFSFGACQSHIRKLLQDRK